MCIAQPKRFSSTARRQGQDRDSSEGRKESTTALAGVGAKRSTLLLAFPTHPSPRPFPARIVAQVPSYPLAAITGAWTTTRRC